MPHIVSNLLLAGLAAAGTPVPAGSGQVAGLLIAACAGITAAILVIASEDIVRLLHVNIASS